jgi:hypothetical protein
MDQLLAQFDIILSGIRWQLIIAALTAAAFTEQFKKIPWIVSAENAKKAGTANGYQLTAIWAINATLPELICINACLVIPGVLPPGIDVVTAVFVGYLTGTASSKIHNMFLKYLLGKVDEKIGGRK